MASQASGIDCSCSSVLHWEHGTVSGCNSPESARWPPRTYVKPGSRQPRPFVTSFCGELYEEVMIDGLSFGATFNARGMAATPMDRGGGVRIESWFPGKPTVLFGRTGPMVHRLEQATTGARRALKSFGVHRPCPLIHRFGRPIAVDLHPPVPSPEGPCAVPPPVCRTPALLGPGGTRCSNRTPDGGTEWRRGRRTECPVDCAPHVRCAPAPRALFEN